MTHGTGRHGKKISEFTAQTSYQNGDQINIVRNGTNFRVDASALAAFLGVTGTIAQIPNSDAPFLEQPSTAVNKIRGLEAGKGTIPSLTARNNVKVDHNFVNGTGGAAVIQDITSAQTLLRSLVAGTGISVAVVGDSIQIATITAPVTTKTVVIEKESDFPAAVGGVITLASDTDYLIVADVTTANRFSVPNNVVVRASDSSVVTLTYTGINTMFTGVNTSFKITKIRVNPPNGTLFAMSGAATIFQIDDVTVDSCDKLGTIDGVLATLITNAALSNIVTDGILFSGTHSVLVIERLLFNQIAGTVLDFGTAVFSSISIITAFATITGGTTFVSGLANSGNIAVGGLGVLLNNRTFGAGAVLNNISPNDARWNFTDNNAIADTRPDSLLTLESNATETVISATDTPVLIAGTWVDQRASQFTNTAAGRATYNGEKSTTVPITLAANLKGATGGDQQVTVFAAKNGSVITASKIQITMDSAKATAVTVVWQDSLDQNDFIEFFVENNTDTVNIIVADAAARIN